MSLERSELRFSLDRDGKITALDGGNRVRMGVPVAGAGQLAAIREIHLANLRGAACRS